MQIKQAKYISSSTSVNNCPNTTLPEFAFIGRSNVGKSSLINMLTNNGRLAMTSSKPGKTILINHFLIDENWYLVDLPGYGYAKRSKEQVDKLKIMIDNYILHRENLFNIFLLVDSNLSPQKIDLDFVNFLGLHSIPFSIVFTKTDKSSKNIIERNIREFKKNLSLQWEQLPPMFSISSVGRIGREELLEYIGEIINQ